MIPEGYAFVTQERDAHGNLTEERYFDAEGNSVACSGGYAILQREYNVWDQMVFERYLNPEEKPMVLRSRFLNVNMTISGALHAKPTLMRTACQESFRMVMQRLNGRTTKKDVSPVNAITEQTANL